MKKNPRGFTLLEMILVLFLVTLMAGLSAFFFTGLSASHRLNATGAEISASIRHARSLARITMRSQAVLIDLDNGIYAVEGRTPKSVSPGCAIRLLDPIVGEITHGRYAITFNPTGGCRGPSIILAAKKKWIRIDIDPIIGAVAIRS